MPFQDGKEKRVVTIRQLEDKYLTALVYRTLKRIPDHTVAKHIVVNCFNKLYRSQRTFDSYADGARYLNTAVSNAANNELAKTVKDVKLQKALKRLAQDGNLERDMEMIETLSMLLLLKDQLSPQRKAVIALHIDGLTTKEIAEQLGMTEQNVLNTKNDALEQLKASLLKLDLFNF